MQYTAIVAREGKYQVAIFPDAPGCQTQADPGEKIEDQAAEALHGWIAATLSSGQVAPLPRRRTAPKGARAIKVKVPFRLAVKVLLRWGRHEAGLTQTELAQPVIARMENPDQNITLETIERVADALGMEIELRRRPNAA